MSAYWHYILEGVCHVLPHKPTDVNVVPKEIRNRKPMEQSALITLSLYFAVIKVHRIIMNVY